MWQLLNIKHRFVQEIIQVAKDPKLQAASIAHPKARRVTCIQARLAKEARDPRARRVAKEKDPRVPSIQRLSKVAREARDPRARRVAKEKDPRVPSI